MIHVLEIGTPLLAIFALQDVAALLLYLLVLSITCLLIDRLEAQTGLYGRITLAIALSVTLVVALPLVPVLGMEVGLIAFFSALFAGIAVYNFRRIPTSNRFQGIVITAGLFSLLLALVRSFSTPAVDGLLQTVHPIHVAGGVVMVIVAGALTDVFAHKATFQSPNTMNPRRWRAAFSMKCWPRAAQSTSSGIR